jgi:[ribosomal protein S5]-alanine N-acetyltransferase
MLIKAVIFDMDGLMLDTEPLYRKAWKQACSECGCELSDAIYTRLIGRSRKDAEQIMLEMFGSEFPLEKFRTSSRKSEAIALSGASVTKKPGLDDLLSFLESRHILRAIATSTERNIALPLLAVTGLVGRFDAVATGDEVASGKPSPDLYLLAAKRLGVDPTACLVLEDAESGIVAAHKAGMHVYIVPDLVPPLPAFERLAQATFNSLAEVTRNLEIASIDSRASGIDIKSLRTERLIAVPLSERDRQDLLRMHRDQRVMATLGGVRSEDESNRWLIENLEHWSRYGFGIWIFRDANDGQFVGRCGLRYVEVGGGSELELAYAILSSNWGMGFATEMTKVILKMGLDHLQMESVVALIDSANTRSRRVADKLGFRFERNVVWKDLPAMLYRFSRDA